MQTIAATKPNVSTLGADDEGVLIKENVIYKSSEYEAFRHYESNRKISEDKVARIQNSMLIKHLIAPILVNEKLYIIDGQHRFTACENLGVDFYFIMKKGLTEDDIPAYNTNAKNWFLTDYLDAYCLEGIPVYLDVKEYMERYDVPLSTALRFLTGNKYIHDNRLGYYGKGAEEETLTKQFQDGVFELTTYDPDEVKIKQYVEIREKLKDRDANYNKYWTKETLLYALMSLLDNPQYKHQQLIKSLDSVKGVAINDIIRGLKTKTKQKEFVEEFQKIYNHAKKHTTIFK